MSIFTRTIKIGFYPDEIRFADEHRSVAVQPVVFLAPADLNQILFIGSAPAGVQAVARQLFSETDLVASETLCLPASCASASVSSSGSACERPSWSLPCLLRSPPDWGTLIRPSFHGLAVRLVPLLRPSPLRCAPNHALQRTAGERRFFLARLFSRRR